MDNTIQELKKALVPIPDAVPSLKSKTANELAGPCPWCGGTDRFVVFLDSSRFMCRQCTPKGGDVIDFYCKHEGADIKGLAARYLNSSQVKVTPKVTGRYDYHDQAGILLYWKERIEPGKDGRAKDFYFYHGNKEKGRGCTTVL